MLARHPLLMLYESLNAASGHVTEAGEATACEDEAIEFSLAAKGEAKTKARVVLFSQPANDGTVDETGEPELVYVVVVQTRLHACVYLGAPELAYRVWFGKGTADQQAAWDDDLHCQQVVPPAEAVLRYGAELPTGIHCACTQKALEVR